MAKLPLLVKRFGRRHRHGIRESDGDLKAKMDAAISSVKADGSLNARSKVVWR